MACMTPSLWRNYTEIVVLPYNTASLLSIKNYPCLEWIIEWMNEWSSVIRPWLALQNPRLTVVRFFHGVRAIWLYESPWALRKLTSIFQNEYVYCLFTKGIILSVVGYSSIYLPVHSYTCSDVRSDSLNGFTSSTRSNRFSCRTSNISKNEQWITDRNEFLNRQPK